MSAFVTLISVDGERFSVEKSVLKEGSAYFGAGLSERWDGGKSAEVQMSCEPQIIRYLIQLVKYGTWEALPHNISHADRLKLQKEADFYQIVARKEDVRVLERLEVPEKHQRVASVSDLPFGKCQFCEKTAPVSSAIIHISCGTGYTNKSFDHAEETRCSCNPNAWFKADGFIQVFRCLKCLSKKYK